MAPSQATKLKSPFQNWLGLFSCAVAVAVAVAGSSGRWCKGYLEPSPRNWRHETD